MALLPDIFIPTPNEPDDTDSLRERFVDEYLFDFDPQLAMVRLGLKFGEAAIAGHKMWTDPKVQNLIAQKLRERSEDEIASKQAVIAGLLREANDRNGKVRPMDRINAWKALGKLLGMETNKIEVKGGTGVMVIPATPDANTWEKVSVKEQRKLKRKVKQK